MSVNKKGLLVVLSGPSGVGKGTVRQHIFSKENCGLNYSISATSRLPRPGEKDGVDYFFKTRAQFEKMIQTEQLLEYAEFVDNYYGTPVDYVRDSLEAGQDIFLEITVDGATQVRNKFPDGLFIFLAPPNFRELKNRIMNRGTESETIINNRLKEAKEEIEMMSLYDYVVVNDSVEVASAKVISIITAEHCRISRIAKIFKQQLEE